MIKSRFSTSSKMPIMAKQYLSNARCGLLMTVLAIVVLVVMYKQDCLLGSKAVVTQKVTGPKDLAKDQIGVESFYPKFQSKAQIFYGIMFDAGSTGSRIHVYQFSQTGQDGFCIQRTFFMELSAQCSLENPDSALKLMNETFEEIKPGLSYYRKESNAAAKSLVPLLDIAMAKVPPAKRMATPVALKATAGLRLLPGNLANVILNEVHKVISEYPFRINQDGVQIMDGTDEGIFSWMTVNFLLGSLSGQNKMVAALDLGGGSTQITFVPNSQVTYEKSPKDYLTNVTLFGTDYRLYTHSYLGLGIMSARYQLMGGKESTSTKAPKSNVTDVRLSSTCLPPDYHGKFEHQGHSYQVGGSSGTGFDTCYESVRNLIINQDYDVDKVEELKTLPLYIFSYYYDRAVETGLIDAEKGGEIILEDYKNKALSICKDHPEKKMPYLCMDLVYIYSLLKDGFGLPHDKHFYLKKKIGGVEISWALGAMFDMLQENTNSS